MIFKIKKPTTDFRICSSKILAYKITNNKHDTYICFAEVLDASSTLTCLSKFYSKFVIWSHKGLICLYPFDIKSDIGFYNNFILARYNYYITHSEPNAARRSIIYEIRKYRIPIILIPSSWHKLDPVLSKYHDPKSRTCMYFSLHYNITYMKLYNNNTHVLSVQKYTLQLQVWWYYGHWLWHLLNYVLRQEETRKQKTTPIKRCVSSFSGIE